MNSTSTGDNQNNWRIKAWFPDLDQKTHDLLKRYFDHVVASNKAAGLVSTKTAPKIDVLHFADSILGCRLVNKKINKNNILHDLGSGAGFPGLVYGILFPDQKVVLVDFDDRKVEFLKSTISMLGLTNVSVEAKKVETFGPDSISQALCREFVTIPMALLMLRKTVSLGGAVYHFKGHEWSQEVVQIPTQLCSSWNPALLGEYTLPVVESKLFVVETTKI